ncbi:MAG: phage tail tape measure protein, partial [Alphaproteobacteria bacterium HGW-Alphaproteobacteria-13]
MSGNRLSLIVQFNSAGLDKLNGGLRNIVGLSKRGATALRSFQQDSARLKREIAATGKELRGASGNVTELIDRERALAAQLDETNRKIDRQKRLLAIAADADRIAERGRELRGRGRDNMIEGAAMAAPFILAAREAGNFSSGMVDLQQKAELTDKQTAQLERTILRAAAAAHQLPEATREGVDILAGFGLDPRRAALMIAPIGRLGTAMKVEMADGAAAAFANYQNLKVAVSDTSRALDIMAAAGNAGAFEVRDMARHFPSLTAQLNALGEEGLSAVGNLSAALQIARRTTGTSDEAATNVNSLLRKINAPVTIRAFKKNFGVDLPAAMKKLRDQGYDTFEAIAMITKQATGGDLSRIGFLFENAETQGAVRALVQNLDDYRKIRDEVAQSEGTVGRAFDQRVAKDATVQWRSFMATVSNIAIVTGNALLPALGEAAKSVQGTMRHVLAWTEANPALTAGIVKLAGGLIAAKIGFGAVQFAVGGMLGPLSTAYRLFMQFRAVDAMGQRITFLGRTAARAGPMVARGFGLVRTAALFLARGVARAGMMMLANPVVLVITAIVAVLAGAAYLVWKHWDKIKGAFNTGSAIVGRAVGFVKRHALAFLSGLGPLGVVAGLVIRHWSTIRTAFGNGIRAVGTAVKGGLAFLRGFVGNFISIGRAIIDGLVTGIKAAPGKIWAALKSIIGGAWSNAKSFLGINSPSRLFMQMGGFVSEGLAVGIDRGRRLPADSARRLAQGVAGGFALPRSPFAASAV